MALPATDSADVFGKRYGEVLLVGAGESGPEAAVYNTYPLNDCPADQWATLDATAIARAHGAPAALLNGPRYWLMDSITKTDPTSLPKESFGGLEMYLQASVDVGPLAEATTPYRPHAVDRKTVFTFDAGRTVHELHTADGSTFVMQTWSQMVDTHLSEADLDGLATRLHLPEGWTYTSRTLTQPLRIVTTSTAAQVLQDELRNSYSLETTG